jgi:GH15 family glucan-1,4-alpha-glucosidase
VHRYEPATAPGTDGWDGLHGQEGAFLPVSFMAVGALAAVGRLDEAHDRLDALCAQLPRLLPEMWDPLDDRGLGNTPLVWTHMELVRALYLLDAFDRRERFGRVGLLAWRVARYVRLRRRRADLA